MSDIEVAIKYKVVKLDKVNYVLLPYSLLKGESNEECFVTDKEQVPYLCNEPECLKNKYLVDINNMFIVDELRMIYDYDGDDVEFLINYFYDDYKNIVSLVDIEKSTLNHINLKLIKDEESDLTYCMPKSIPSIVLNENSLNDILNNKTIKEMKLALLKYKQTLETFKDFNEKKGITRINVRNGHVTSLETEKKVSSDVSIAPKSTSSAISTIKGDISYCGLRDYLRERIFGHDEEIDTIAQKLYMNYTAIKGDPIESILIVGPTGTGKTETVKAASEYLNLPFFETNASNIVPQGIVGMSIEDVIVGLFEAANGDLDKAERGLIFLDEFDKLNDSYLEIKSSVKNILLTFTAGGIFPIDNNRYSFQFDTSMVSKIYAGVFDRITEKEKTIGFTSKNDNYLLKSDNLIRKKIIDKKYFSLEELSRISTILGYDDLSVDVKKKILLYSKLSEYVKKKERYKRQFNIDLELDKTYIDRLLETISKDENGMRSINNYVKKSLNDAEKNILENEEHDKKLVLSAATVDNCKDFKLI